MYGYDSDSDSDGFELTSEADFSSKLASKCDPPITVLPEYDSLPQRSDQNYESTDIPVQENSARYAGLVDVPVGKFVWRGRAWRGNGTDGAENCGVPVQVKQNFQRQNLNTSLDSKDFVYKPVGRGMSRNGASNMENSGGSVSLVKGLNNCDAATQAEVTACANNHDVYDEELGTSVDPVPAPLENQVASEHSKISNLPSNLDSDDIVKWDSEMNAEQYSTDFVLKPKVNPTFQPKIVGKSEAVSFEEIRKTNPDVSPRWLASTLAKKQLQPRSDEMQRILRTVDHMWFDDSRKDKSHVSQYLTKVYTDSINPFVLVGYLLDQVRDSHTAKTTTLSFFIIKEFDKWYKANKRKVYPEKYLSVDLQMHVFDICTRNHLTMLDMAVRCFHLCYTGNDHFLPTVKRFLEKKKYKEVSRAPVKVYKSLNMLKCQIKTSYCR